MAKTHQVRTWWADYRCEPGEPFEIYGRVVRLRPQTHPAGRAIEAALRSEGSSLRSSARTAGAPPGSQGRPVNLVLAPSIPAADPWALAASVEHLVGTCDPSALVSGGESGDLSSDPASEMTYRRCGGLS